MPPNPQPKCEASWSVNIKGRYRTKQWKQSTGSSLRMATLECGDSVMPETRFCERDVSTVNTSTTERRGPATSELRLPGESSSLSFRLKI